MSRQSRPKDVLHRYHAWEQATDRTNFQWRARLLQSMHRIDLGFEPTLYRDSLRGALLPMPEAKDSLSNYLTETIRDVVRREVNDRQRSKGKLFSKPRIYNNLLSSQPLSFNLFGELAEDLSLASRVFRGLTGGRVDEVTEIGFEVSPGRGDRKYIGDRSAFDVYVRFTGPDAQNGFIGIEVKYHEDLNDSAAKSRPRYEEVAAEMGCFDLDRVEDLKQSPLQQLWRDHLLTGAHKSVDAFDDAFFVVVYPQDNTACVDALAQYRSCLTDESSFDAWTLESIVETLRKETDAEWVSAFYSRYLDFERVDAVLRT